MSDKEFDRDPIKEWSREDEEEWDRESWDRWMNTLRSSQHDPEEYGGSLGGTPYQGGVFSSSTYGGGAEYYSVTGMYENPLFEKHGRKHRGKGPKSFVRSDEAIHDEVCERLTHHPLIDASQMEVHVHDGEVTFTGEIPNRQMKHMAEDVTAEIPGVLEVFNNLRVTRGRAA
jgi:osmotically-inducible protein OsmY